MQHKTSLDTAWTFADDDEEEAEDRVFLGAFDRIEARSAERASVDRRKKYLTCGWRSSDAAPWGGSMASPCGVRRTAAWHAHSCGIAHRCKRGTYLTP